MVSVVPPSLRRARISSLQTYVQTDHLLYINGVSQEHGINISISILSTAASVMACVSFELSSDVGLQNSPALVYSRIHLQAWRIVDNDTAPWPSTCRDQRMAFNASTGAPGCMI
jgi:hypothetical protein